MKVRILPGKAVGCVTAPPSKSYAHRLMICAGLSEGGAVVEGISKSQDMLATLDCLRALGTSVQQEGGTVTLRGSDGAYPDGSVFPCRESGSTLRFMIPIALAKGENAVFQGSERLIERGVGVYETLFREKGIRLEKTPDSIAVSGHLNAGAYIIPGGISSQFVSGLLFALPMLAGDSTLRVTPPVESRPYIDITIDAMRRFGVHVTEPEPNVFHIPGGQRYAGSRMQVEGDWSNAAALLALDLAGGQVTVTGLNPDSLQGDKVCRPLLQRIAAGDPEPMDLSDCPDLGPVLFAAAALARGGCFTGTKRLRIKESDRAAAMAEELAKFGIAVTVEDNRVLVHPGTLTAPSVPLSSHNDHRIVMAMALLCSVVGGTITGAEAINKSFPDFFEVLRGLGLEVKEDA